MYLHEKITGEGEGPQNEGRKCRGNPNPQTEFPRVLCPDFPDVTVHGFGVDAPRAADAPQVGEQPLEARLEFARVGAGLFETQAFKYEARAGEALCNLVFGFIIREHDNFNALVKKRWNDIALEEVDDCHAVVGGDEDLFSHYSFLNREAR